MASELRFLGSRVRFWGTPKTTKAGTVKQKNSLKIVLLSPNFLEDIFKDHRVIKILLEYFES